MSLFFLSISVDSPRPCDKSCCDPTPLPNSKAGADPGGGGGAQAKPGLVAAAAATLGTLAWLAAGSG